MHYKPISEASRQALTQTGLTPHQAAIYEALIQHGPQKATRLAFLAGVPRTLSYKALEVLEAEGLVSKKDELGRVSVFVPAHPLKLKELMDRRLEEAQGAKVALEGTLSRLIHEFDAISSVLPEKELYAQVARYAGKGCLEELSVSERSSLKVAIENLLNRLEGHI